MRNSLIITLALGLSLQSIVFARDNDSELERTKSQIHILNLLNGLELNKEQMELILDAARQAENIRLKAKDELSVREKEITAVYNEVLEAVKSGSVVIPKEITLNVHKMDQELDQARGSLQARLTALVTKIKDSLEPHQLYVLEGYQSCIIPQVKEGRIGQAEDSAGFARVLERVHFLPEDRYSSKKLEIAQNAIDRAKSRLPAGYILDEERLKAKLLKAMDEVRAMPDIDFTVKKDEIAKNIKTTLHPERPPLNIGIKIGNFLLQPDIIPLLEQRLVSQ